MPSEWSFSTARGFRGVKPCAVEGVHSDGVMLILSGAGDSSETRAPLRIAKTPSECSFSTAQGFVCKLRAV
jgi:hypothetical protein